jgi:hypothetical protein
MGIDPPQPAPPLMLLSTVLHRNSPDPTLCYSTRNPFELYSAALYHNILLLQHYDTANIVLLGILRISLWIAVDIKAVTAL